jgi:replicative DNA helicase
MLSQEMPAGELVDRCAANLGRVSMDALTTGRFLEEDWSRMAEAAEAMGRLPLFIDDQPALTLLDIRSKARRSSASAWLALVVVDYLQPAAAPAPPTRATGSSRSAGA